MNSNTVDRILNLSFKLLNDGGCKAFSYNDLAKELGIKTASIHYHFPSKADLVNAIAKKLRLTINEMLKGIDDNYPSPEAKLKQFLETFKDRFNTSGNICMCSMMSSDFANLPYTAKEETKGVWKDIEGWIASVLKAGKEDGTFSFEGSPEVVSKAVFASLEGSTISATTFQDRNRVNEVTSWIWSSLTKKEHNEAASL